MKETSFLKAITEDSRQACDLEFRTKLMVTLVNYIDRRRLVQDEVSYILEISSQRAKDLLDLQVHLFSTTELLYLFWQFGYYLSPGIDERGILRCTVEPVDFF